MSSATPYSILIVEDERIVAADLQQTLEGMGYDAFAIASSADEALARASERVPHLVLMDIRIKGKRDGIETATLLRERHGVPVVFLTAHADEATLDRAKKAEPHGYLMKPVRPAELRSAVEVSIYKHEMERRERERERWFQTTLRSIADSVIAIDVSGTLRFMNPAAEEMLGHPEAELVGRSMAEMSARIEVLLPDGATPLPRDQAPSARALAGEVVQHAELLVRSAAAPAGRWFAVDARPVKDPDGSIQGAVIVSRDVSELRLAREKLRDEAVRDELTGLLNRRGFRDQAVTAVLLANRTLRPLAILCVDLDGMKAINDELGHATGDLALVETAQLLRETFRSSDVIARLGGDEFVVLAHEYADDQDGATVRDRFDRNLSAHRARGEHPFQLAASLGITIYDPRRGFRTVDELMDDADRRMYEVKRRQRLQRSQAMERM